MIQRQNFTHGRHFDFFIVKRFWLPLLFLLLFLFLSKGHNFGRRSIGFSFVAVVESGGVGGVGVVGVFGGVGGVGVVGGVGGVVGCMHDSR